MIKLIQKYPLLTIALYTMALLLPNLTALEVGIMEARNFITAREMLTDGNWILTTFNGIPRYQKPPLPTWITAFFGYLFGLDKIWALRLPGVFMVMTLGMGIFKLSRKLTLSKPHSLYNSLIAITSLYVVLIIFDAPWDIYASTFLLWSIYYMMRWFAKEKTVQSGVLTVLFMAASVLSKGPVALYALLLPFLIAYFSCFYTQEIRKRIGYFVGLFIAGLIIGFSWYLYVRYVDSENFTRIAAKETANWSSYNVRPFYYYWSFFVQSGIWTLPAFMSLLYPYLKTRVIHLKAYQFTLLWTVVAVVLLSIIPEKKSRYLMPVLIPLAINCGFYIEYVIRSFKDFTNSKEKTPVYIHFGILALLFISSIGIVLWAPVFKEVPWVVYILLVIPLFIGLFIFKELLFSKNIKRAFYWVLMGLLAIGFAISPIEKSPIVNKNYRAFEKLKNPSQLPLYGYKVNVAELIWAYNEKIPNIKEFDVKGNTLESQFLVLECAVCDYNIEEEFNGYHLQMVDSININRVSKGAKRYKRRKAARIFLATRK